MDGSGLAGGVFGAMWVVFALITILVPLFIMGCYVRLGRVARASEHIVELIQFYGERDQDEEDQDG